MTQIKNLHLLDDMKESDIDKMEAAAGMHKRYSSISFKILEYSAKKVVIRITQDKSSAEKYFDVKRLTEIVHETFDRFFKDKKIMVRAFPFEQSPVNQVTDAYIRNQMESNGIKLKDISQETGIDYTQLSALAAGNKPLSQSAKAMFYYYFKFKELSGEQ